MGLDDRGEIAIGKRADFVLLNDKLEIKKVIYKGEIV
jgi:N-acetylglucosamine-6-phosphate deacetylase